MQVEELDGEEVDNDEDALEPLETFDQISIHVHTELTSLHTIWV